MPTYAFKARTRNGKLIKGTLESSAEKNVLEILEQRGVYPIEVSAERELPRFLSLFQKKKKLKHDEKILFTRQLEAMLKSGISLTGSLASLSEQAESDNLREILVATRKEVEGGATFTQALERHPSLYDSMYVNMIRAGEESGTLTEMLERIAELLEYDAETRARIRAATFYPLLVIGELGLAMIVIVRFVFPRFKALFSGHAAALPLPTKIMIAMSDFAEGYWVHLLIVVVVAVIAGRWWVRTPGGERLFHGIILKVPIFGEIALKILMSRFSRILSSLLQSGVPLLRALTIVERTIDNVVIKSEIQIMEDGIRQGRGLADAIKNRGVFPSPVCKMLEVGENTGTIEVMLERISMFYDSQVDYRIKNLTTAIEPILLAVLGASVLFIALAVFMPMWNLMGIMSGG